ncbi:metalloprotease [Haloferacaceae archaeon DSL9]
MSVDSGSTLGGLRFSGSEIQDLLVAWLALGVAFAIFFERGAAGFANASGAEIAVIVLASLLTAGIAFLLHELAHKVVAVRYGQLAEFRADYGMLFLAIMSAFLGFIFAAPGAVHHRGRITPRQHGLIALAGPVTNLGLAVAFVPVLFAGVAVGSYFLAYNIGWRGIIINLFLAAFNMIPYGPLDGKTVISWSKLVWALVFVPSVIVALGALLLFGF